jgi:GNAT superfamily N-acetyltransferase
VSPARRVTAPEPLGSHHAVEAFRCGSEELDEWLVRHSLQSHAAGSSRTTVVCSEGRVVGFYSLAAGSVAPEAAPARVGKGMGRHPIPVVLLTRLAVDESAQGSGLGTVLLKNALLKVLDVAETVAVRALLVHAKNEAARAWYMRRGAFLEAAGDPLKLFLLLKDIRATVASPQ